MTLSFNMEQDLLPGAAGRGGVVEQWWVTVNEGAEEDGTPGPVVCRIHIVRGLLGHPELWETLDALEGDLEAVGGTILDVRRGDLVDDLDEEIEPSGDRLLILNSVTLSGEWRGYGLGALFAGVALETLAPGARLAATFPAPLTDAEEAEREVAIHQLGTVWSQIGFASYKDGVWAVDFALVDFYKRLATLRERYGVTGW